MVAQPPFKLQLTIDPPALLCVEGALLAHQMAGHPDSSAIDLARRIVIAILMKQETLSIGFASHAQEEKEPRSKGLDSKTPGRGEDCPF